MTTARRLAEWGTAPLEVPAAVDAAARRHAAEQHCERGVRDRVIVTAAPREQDF